MPAIQREQVLVAEQVEQDFEGLLRVLLVLRMRQVSALNAAVVLPLIGGEVAQPLLDALLAADQHHLERFAPR